jgi:hypothetical protein
MRYLIICKDKTLFYSEWYDYENHYNPDTIEMIIDLVEDAYSINGKDFNNIEIDHL